MRDLLLSAALCVCVVAAQERSGSISGTVVDSITGAPLNKVTMSTGGVATVRSDSEGHFTIAGLEPGDYQLKGNRNGYLETLGKRMALTAGQNLKDLQFRMKRFGVIAGTVRDEDGEPLNGVTVNVSEVRYRYGKRSVVGQSSVDTDDQGQYRVADLTPGKYYVRAAKDPSPPRMVEVAVGDRVTGIDITLGPARGVRVSGRAVFPAGTRLSNVALRDGADDLAFEIHGSFGAEGNFEFFDVPPGAYTLTAVAAPPKKPAIDIMELQFQGKFEARVPVQVADVPVKNVRVEILPGAEVGGHVSGSDGVVMQEIVFDNDPGQPVFTFVHGDRTFSVNLS